MGTYAYTLQVTYGAKVLVAIRTNPQRLKMTNSNRIGPKKIHRVTVFNFFFFTESFSLNTTTRSTPHNGTEIIIATTKNDTSIWIITFSVSILISN